MRGGRYRDCVALRAASVLDRRGGGRRRIHRGAPPPSYRERRLHPQRGEAALILPAQLTVALPPSLLSLATVPRRMVLREASGFSLLPLLEHPHEARVVEEVGGHLPAGDLFVTPPLDQERRRPILERVLLLNLLRYALLRRGHGCWARGCVLVLQC